MKASVYGSLLGVLLVGCSASQPSPELPTESTQVEQDIQQEASLQDDAEPAAEEIVIQVEERFQRGALILDIQDVRLAPNQITVRVELSNPSSRVIRFYPNQGHLSTGRDELKANIFLTDDALSGVLDPQEQKSGVLIFSSRFEQELDFSNVRSIQLSLGEVIDMASIEPEQVNIAFSLD
ncbi:MAG: hypothetical protein AAFR31_07000 [Cyanobacteria bacterium J06627_8]